VGHYARPELLSLAIRRDAASTTLALPTFGHPGASLAAAAAPSEPDASAPDPLRRVA
jgi:aliphatic nitrilase